jgi:hypothetical protein
MRKMKSIFATFCLMIILIACEQDVITYKGPYHVRFTESTDVARESYNEPINIQVHNAGPVLDEDITITYLLSGDAREGVDYIVLGDKGKVVIPAGEHFGNIQIQLINNSNNILRSQNIEFELRTVDNKAVKVGEGTSRRGNKFTFTIFDDCILGGYYYGRETPSSPIEDDVVITSADCENYILSNWNINFFNTPFPLDLTFVDNGDNTLTIPPQEEDAFPEDLATIEGIGVVDAVTGKINFTIKLVDFDGQPELSFTLYRD